MMQNQDCQEKFPQTWKKECLLPLLQFTLILQSVLVLNLAQAQYPSSPQRNLPSQIISKPTPNSITTLYQKEDGPILKPIATWSEDKQTSYETWDAILTNSACYLTTEKETRQVDLPVSPPRDDARREILKVPPCPPNLETTQPLVPSQRVPFGFAIRPLQLSIPPLQTSIPPLQLSIPPLQTSIQGASEKPNADFFFEYQLSTYRYHWLLYGFQISFGGGSLTFDLSTADIVHLKTSQFVNSTAEFQPDWNIPSTQIHCLVSKPTDNLMLISCQGEKWNVGPIVLPVRDLTVLANLILLKEDLASTQQRSHRSDWEWPYQLWKLEKPVALDRLSDIWIFLFSDPKSCFTGDAGTLRNHLRELRFEGVPSVANVQIEAKGKSILLRGSKIERSPFPIMGVPKNSEILRELEPCDSISHTPK